MLDHKYSAFGRVIEGMAAVDGIAVGEPPAAADQDRPRDDRRTASGPAGRRRRAPQPATPAPSSAAAQPAAAPAADAPATPRRAPDASVAEQAAAAAHRQPSAPAAEAPAAGTGRAGPGGARG